MDFRTSATRELSAALDRLIQAADSAAIAARAEAAAEAQLTIDAVTTRHAAVQQALQEQIDARDALERENAALAAAKGGLEADHEALAAEKAGIEAEKSALLAEKHALEAEKNALDADRRALEQDLALLRDRVDQLGEESDSQQSISDALRGELETLRAEASTLRADAAALRAEANALRAESDTVQHELQMRLDEAHRAAVDATARAADWRAEHGRTIRDQAVALVSRTLDRMLAVSAAFGGVATEDEVLAAVVEALATEFPRVALFKLGLNQLEAIQHVGFGFPSDYTHLVIPQTIGTVLDRAVTSGQIELLSGAALDDLDGTPFGGSPACALALPIDLDGDLCAVLYADDSGHPHQAFATTDLRKTFALLLRQLAAPHLRRIPAEMKAIAELREYAAHLVAELENMYAADAAHKKPAEVRRRLQDNLECARGIYAQRVSSEAPAAAGLLEEELTLAASVAHATPFGRDLTALLGAAEPRAAEA